MMSVRNVYHFSFPLKTRSKVVNLMKITNVGMFGHIWGKTTTITKGVWNLWKQLSSKAKLYPLKELWFKMTLLNCYSLMHQMKSKLKKKLWWLEPHLTLVLLVDHWDCSWDSLALHICLVVYKKYLTSVINSNNEIHLRSTFFSGILQKLKVLFGGAVS